MKKYLILLIIGFAPIYLLGQHETIAEPLFNSVHNTSAATGFNTSISPLNLNVFSGLNFGTMGTGGYMESFISPSLEMPLNKKLSISAGITYSNIQFKDFPTVISSGEFETYSGGLNTLTLHSAGLYRVNEKLSFTGSAFKTVNPALNSRLNPTAIQIDRKSVV